MLTTTLPRRAGLLIPISALPNKYGIGGFDEKAYSFIDFLSKAGMSYWQILPYGHTDGYNCPYQCYSNVAGNPLYIDLDELVKIGLIERTSLEECEVYSRRIDYEGVKEKHYKILRKAFHNSQNNPTIQYEMQRFSSENSNWIRDYSLFMALLEHFHEKPLWEWEPQIRNREKAAMDLYTEQLKDEIRFFEFLQYMFFKQWSALKKYANSKGVKIIGDIPIYPAPNSVEVWANPELFVLDEEKHVKLQAAVPPDYFSKTGQLWGNPIYNWDIIKEKKFEYWINRFKIPNLFWEPDMKQWADVYRIDHARAIQDYYTVPVGEKTAINGWWNPGPRMDFFNAIRESLKDVKIISEDLGIIGDDVRALMKQARTPGMRVLDFGLDLSPNNLNSPYKWDIECVGYTGTHDNKPIVAAIKELKQEARNNVLRYMNVSSDENMSIATAAIRTAFNTDAFLVIVPMSDILGMGDEGRINTPGKVDRDKNWTLQFLSEDFTDELASFIYWLVKTSNRLAK